MAVSTLLLPGLLSVVTGTQTLSINLHRDFDLSLSHTLGHTTMPSVSVNTATSASSQVNPIFCMSLLTVLLHSSSFLVDLRPNSQNVL